MMCPTTNLNPARPVGAGPVGADPLPQDRLPQTPRPRFHGPSPAAHNRHPGHPSPRHPGRSAAKTRDLPTLATRLPVHPWPAANIPDRPVGAGLPAKPLPALDSAAPHSPASRLLQCRRHTETHHPGRSAPPRHPGRSAAKSRDLPTQATGSPTGPSPHSGIPDHPVGAGLPAKPLPAQDSGRWGPGQRPTAQRAALLQGPGHPPPPAGGQPSGRWGLVP